METCLETPLTSCSLCDQALPRHSIISEKYAFCCAGCHAVFNILSAKNQLANFQEHPLFQQALKSGLISNPALLEQIRSNRPEMAEGELQKLHLEVGEMWCPFCAEVIQWMLLKEKGVRNCVIDYATDLASIEYCPRYISKEQIYQQITALGYSPVALEDAAKKAVSFDLTFRFIVATFCSLNVMMFAYPLYATYFDHDPEGYGSLFAWLSLFVSLPVLFYSGWPILRRFFNSLQVGLFGMEALVVMGVSAAFGLSLYELITGGTKVYFDSMTVVIVFVLLGKIIEAKAKFSAKNSLLRLSRALPRRGRKRISDETYHFVPLKEISPGDIVQAFTGEKIVLDGIVIEGEGACDESLMTGEALPVTKRKGSLLLAGTILQQGRVAYQVTSHVEQTALHTIIEMVQQDIGHKSSYVRAADSIVRWFVPSVVFFALAVALFCWIFGLEDQGKTAAQTAIIRAVSILLISCPCAIGIAAPLAESQLLNSLAALGAIIRNRGCLQYLGKETIFVFDKTGTITEGFFHILSGLEILPKTTQSLLKGLASQSVHPIACAVSQSIQAEPIPFSYVEEIVGKGLKGICNGETYLFGSAQFLQSYGISISPQTASTVYFAKENHCLTALALGDRIRSQAKETIAALLPSKTLLLSGDSEFAVKAVAETCGFDHYRFGCSPLEKREEINVLREKGEIVCMMGDGINDAPALTGAHIGISVVNATDISIQVSDILLTTDRLQVIPQICALARKGHRIIKQNLFWAFFYNVIGVGLAAFGVLSPIFAASAMVVSSLIVLFNAKRI